MFNNYLLRSITWLMPAEDQRTRFQPSNAEIKSLIESPQVIMSKRNQIFTLLGCSALGSLKILWDLRQNKTLNSSLKNAVNITGCAFVSLATGLIIPKVLQVFRVSTVFSHLTLIQTSEIKLAQLRKEYLKTITPELPNIVHIEPVSEDVLQAEDPIDVKLSSPLLPPEAGDIEKSINMLNHFKKLYPGDDSWDTFQRFLGGHTNGIPNVVDLDKVPLIFLVKAKQKDTIPTKMLNEERIKDLLWNKRETLHRLYTQIQTLEIEAQASKKMISIYSSEIASKIGKTVSWDPTSGEKV